MAKVEVVPKGRVRSNDLLQKTCLTLAPLACSFIDRTPFRTFCYKAALEALVSSLNGE
jgi:hypothetical protein